MYHLHLVRAFASGVDTPDHRNSLPLGLDTGHSRGSVHHRKANGQPGKVADGTRDMQSALRAANSSPHSTGTSFLRRRVVGWLEFFKIGGFS